jgi:hypothetical protein
MVRGGAIAGELVAEPAAAPGDGAGDPALEFLRESSRL